MCCFISCTFARAQFTEDFSDGDFTNNPTWSGDVAKFIVDNEELRSNSGISNDIFYLSTQSSAAISSEWRFVVNMKLNTSSVNYTDFILMCDSENPNTSDSGYFLRIGNTRDEISLYRMELGGPTIIIDGPDDKTENKVIAVKVTRDNSGLWTVFADFSGGINYQLQGSVFDDTYTKSSFFAIQIRQSSLNFFKNHFFDDIYVGPLVVDTDKPEVLSTTATDKNTITISADEAVNTFGTGFNLNNGYGTPDNVVVNSNEITLTYNTDLANDDYELTINLLSDLAGNQLDTVVKFSYFVLPTPQVGEILFTEIFADPTPSIGLPDAEYVEIYNNSTETLDLTNCTFSDGGSPASLPVAQIAAGEYATLVKEGTEDLFAAYQNIIIVDGFPALNNGGDALELQNANNEILDAVTYTDDFYRDSDKKDGGYSIERIDFVSNCAAASNWIASTNASGGTPSAINSVFGQNPDNAAPQLLGAIITGTNSVELLLNEQPTGTNDLLITNFTLEPSGEQPTEVSFSEATNTISLTFNSTLLANTIYQLRIANLEDCIGNTRSDITTELVSTSPAQAGDLLINELLFNPKDDGVDFIEIYNVSDKYIDLSTLSLARYTDERENEVSLSANKQILYPQEYIAVSIDSNRLKTDYNAARNLIQSESLPPMNNDEGILLLLDNTGTLLDSVPYSEDQHFTLLSDVNGVSLERINFTGLSYDPSNWHSASTSVGYATPGYQNSQFVDVTASTSTLELQSKTFSPDADGYEDLLIVSYNFNTNGNVLNGYVYDLSGRLIYQAINNEVLSTSGSVNWDGIIDNGTKIPVGNYILLLESFSLNDETTRKKLAFSVLGHF